MLARLSTVWHRALACFDVSASYRPLHSATTPDWFRIIFVAIICGMELHCILSPRHQIFPLNAPIQSEIFVWTSAEIEHILSRQEVVTWYNDKFRQWLDEPVKSSRTSFSNWCKTASNSGGIIYRPNICIIEGNILRVAIKKMATSKCEDAATI